jgi:tRNA threonylcarbamoyladenosine biosynthesis protein TsaB
MLLAIDTSTRTMGLALYDGEQVLSEASWLSRDHHSVELAPAVAEMLGRAGCKATDLKALSVAIGPGSFTALRIGLALAKGLALVHRSVVVGIPSLDILAAAQPVSTATLAAVLHAGRGRLACGWYRAVEGRWVSEEKIEVLSPQDLSSRIHSPTQICGELDEAARRLLVRKRVNVQLASPALCVRRPAVLAELAWQRFQDGQMDNPATLSPIYLHYNDPIPG